MSYSCNRRIRNVAITAGAYAAVRAALAFSRRYDFRNRLVVITGGSRGLAYCWLATSPTGRGPRACARDAEELAIAAKELRERRSFVATYTCDLADADDIAKLFARIRREIGSVDVLINNAGIINVGPLETMTSTTINKRWPFTSGRRSCASSTCCPICDVAAKAES